MIIIQEVDGLPFSTGKLIKCSACLSFRTSVTQSSCDKSHLSSVDCSKINADTCYRMTYTTTVTHDMTILVIHENCTFNSICPRLCDLTSKTSAFKLDSCHVICCHSDMCTKKFPNIGPAKNESPLFVSFVIMMPFALFYQFL